jgi:hypothetical protein
MFRGCWAHAMRNDVANIRVIQKPGESSAREPPPSFHLFKIQIQGGSEMYPTKCGCIQNEFPPSLLIDLEKTHVAGSGSDEQGEKNGGNRNIWQEGRHAA